MTTDAEKVLPNWIWVIEVPERAHDLATRYHNKYAKEAIRETMEKWHGHGSKGFQKHYRRDARERYNHFPRTEKYKRYKARRFKSTLDHVKTGRSKRRMTTQYKFRAGGSASGGNLSATLILTFPFKGGTGRFRKEGTHQQFTIEKMILELQRFDEEDPKNLAQWFKEAYMKKVEQHRSKRKRIRIPTR